MASPNRGFDPLSSLFDVPDPGAGHPLLPEVDDAADAPGGSHGASLEYTDPLFKAPADLPARPTEAPDPTLPSRVQPAPAPEPAPVPEPPPAPQVPKVDPLEIARAVGRAAAARAAAAAPAPPPDPPPANKPAKSKKAAPGKGKKRAKSGGSRLESLAARAVRPRSALEAARAAAAVEESLKQEKEQVQEEERAQAIRRAANSLTDQVQALVPELLPRAKAIYVANAMVADERHVLTALWKAHRTKFVADGELERAISATAVLHSLGHVPAGHLVAAHMVTDASDYLVWIDLNVGSAIAAFANARAYFAG